MAAAMDERSGARSDHSSSASLWAMRARVQESAMTYLVASDLSAEPAGERFGALLARPEILRIPGAHNGMAAVQARAAGFEALYRSGAAMSASMGLPDLGVITVDDFCFFVRQVARASG